MKEINTRDLETALVVGDAICCELDVPCGDRGKVIHKVYQKLQELHAHDGSTEQPAPEVETPQ